jgi:hypothetical protein
MTDIEQKPLTKLIAALSKAQGMFKNIEPNKSNPHFKSKYADLEAIISGTKEGLAKNGLAFTQIFADGKLRTILMHESGDTITSDYPLTVDQSPQKFGSAVTYAKRYSLSAILGVATGEDDDGNNASQPTGSFSYNEKTQKKLSSVLALLPSDSKDIKTLNQIHNICMEKGYMTGEQSKKILSIKEAALAKVTDVVADVKPENNGADKEPAVLNDKIPF